MALKKCKECGNEVSSSAKVCPKCGKKLKMGMMKKILIGIGVLILIGAIGSQRDKESEGTANNSVESTPSKKINKAEVVAGAIGEPIEIGHFVYQVDTPKFRKSVGNE